jgi:Kef-type K+ transport system membrane component KefB
MAIGALMNARGLMELIILNIGLERGLITPTLFTIMVLMTLTTTLAAGPLFEFAWRRHVEMTNVPGRVRAH